jgi:hypothetical protein
VLVLTLAIFSALLGQGFGGRCTRNGQKLQQVYRNFL